MKTRLLTLWTSIVNFFTQPFQQQFAVASTGPLSLDLQFFAEPSEPSNTQEPTNPEQPENNEPQEPKNESKEHMIPKSRFDEVNNNYKTVKDQLDKILKQQQDDELKRQKEQGEFELLYNQANQELESYKTDFESTKTRVEQLEGIMTSMLNTKLESIPEEFHDLIPENLSPEQKLDWISKAETKGLFKDQSQEPVGGQTNPSQQEANLESMNPFQLLKAGYGSQK